MKRWVKFYTEALHDRKMRKLGRVDKSVFYDLLLLAGQEDDSGYLPAIEDIAFELDMKITDAKKAIDKLISVGVISRDDDNNIFVTMFQKRQNENLTGYERVKRCREKKKSSANSVIDNTMITEDNAADNVTSDSPMITVEEDKEKEKELEEDKETDKEKNKREKIVADATCSSVRKDRGELKPFGTAENVMLSEAEYQKLCEKLGPRLADEQIEELSLYMGKNDKNAKKYTNHYYTVLSWSRRDQVNDNTSSGQKQAIIERRQPVQKPKTYSFAEVFAMGQQKNGNQTQNNDGEIYSYD